MILNKNNKKWDKDEQLCYPVTESFLCSFLLALSYFFDGVLLVDSGGERGLRRREPVALLAPSTQATRSPEEPHSLPTHYSLSQSPIGALLFKKNFKYGAKILLPIINSGLMRSNLAPKAVTLRSQTRCVRTNQLFNC